ncbi:hypothetical protein KFE98_10680 [bacterium SCSIO 12741]|nr:hypothetical protein KFE98_10680 [bacterium SCSIO 12741]
MKILISALLLAFTFSLTAQEAFFEDFDRAVHKKDFTREELNGMFRSYSSLLTPHSDITQLMAGLQGEKMKQFPLQEFSQEKAYKKGVSRLIKSDNPNQRILAYLVIASAGDKTYEDVLYQKLNEETEEGNLRWATMALLHLKSDRTTPLFDVLVDHETWGDAHMAPLFFQLSPDSLQQTAYRRIHSEKPMARILAAQILTQSPLNDSTELLLKEAVREWDIKIKGYAIYSLKELEVGNLEETLKPLLDSSQTRAIALEALANSPTESDREMVVYQLNEGDTVPDDVLDALLGSKREESVRLGLQTLYRQPVSKNYYFNVFKKKWLYTDEMLPDVLMALDSLENKDHREHLMRAVRGRKDKATTELLLRHIRTGRLDENYWAVDALEGNDNPEVKAALPGFILNPQIHTANMLERAMELEIDTLQAFCRQMYQSEHSSRDWKRASIEYLATFPEAEDRNLFIETLQSDEIESFMKRDAALGLAQLKDQSAVEFIILASEKERSTSDYNCRSYLWSLSIMGGQEAKIYVEQFLKSPNTPVVEMAQELLKEWND